MTLYMPYWQRSRGEMTLVVRTPVREDAASQEMRAAIRQVDRQLPVEHFQTMTERLDESVAQRRFQMQLVTLFAICALLLASLGIYGVVAYSVAQRTNEIGIRMALGAHRASIGQMVLQEGLRPVIGGLIAGVIAALALGRTLESLLFGVQVVDPLTIVMVVVLLLAVATGAVILPALRATRVNPVDALRYE
jgi:ABC-type antimicrobial peptide transport system permease subunit